MASNPLHNAIFDQTGQLQPRQGAFIDAAKYLGTKMFNPWEDSKYTKDEVEIAIGQNAITNLYQEIKICHVTPMHIITTDRIDVPQSCLHPERIISIPFIDELRKKKLWSLVNNE